MCIYTHVYMCACGHFSCVRLCDPMDCSLPGSSVDGILQARSGLPCPPPGDLPNSGIKPVSLMSPALSFSTVATWEALTEVLCEFKCTVWYAQTCGIITTTETVYTPLTSNVLMSPWNLSSCLPSANNQLSAVSPVDQPAFSRCFSHSIVSSSLWPHGL